MKIALDAMGGDLAPKATIEGAVLAARDFGVEVVLVGDRDLLSRELAERKTDGLALTIEHAPESVAMDESPLESVLGKPQSSIHTGLELVKRGEADALVSAGNSGAVMAAAMMILNTLPGVDRPAIASLVPASDGHALLIDAGANTDVKAVNLVQFAVMGSIYAQRVRGIPRPRVGILANGEEDSKGTELTRTAGAMLREMGGTVDYIGYVEGRDINRGKADVVVTDGFTGNVALKTMEGFASFLMGNLRDVFSVGLGRIAFLLVRKRLAAIRARLDPSEYGGAPLLGLEGVTVVAHGSSNPRAIRNAIRAAANEALVEQVNADIAEVLARYPSSAPAKPANKGFRAILGRMRERLHRHPRSMPGAQQPAIPTAATQAAGSQPASASETVSPTTPPVRPAPVESQPAATHREQAETVMPPPASVRNNSGSAVVAEPAEPMPLQNGGLAPSSTANGEGVGKEGACEAESPNHSEKPAG